MNTKKCMTDLLGFNTINEATTFLRKYSTVPLDLAINDNEDKERYQELEEQLNGALLSLSKSNGNLNKLFIVNDAGDIKEDFALILNPKYKDIIPELWLKVGLIIPIVWNPFAEEGKCYVITDKTFVKNVRVNMKKWLINNYQQLDKEDKTDAVERKAK